jgi:hypothetical protein
MVERKIVNLEVAGSIPVVSANAAVMKLVAHTRLRIWWEKSRVGSSPTCGTIHKIDTNAPGVQGSC